MKKLTTRIVIVFLTSTIIAVLFKLRSMPLTVMEIFTVMLIVLVVVVAVDKVVSRLRKKKEIE